MRKQENFLLFNQPINSRIAVLIWVLLHYFVKSLIWKRPSVLVRCCCHDPKSKETKKIVRHLLQKKLRKHFQRLLIDDSARAFFTNFGEKELETQAKIKFSFAAQNVSGQHMPKSIFLSPEINKLES